MRSISELLKVIEGPPSEVDPWDRYDALVDIGRHGTQMAAKVLAGFMKPDQQDGWLHNAAAAGLVHITDPQALEFLIGRLPGADSHTQVCLCEAIGRIGGDRAVAVLLDQIRNGQQRFLRRAAVVDLRWELSRNPGGPVVAALLEAAAIGAVAQDARDLLWRVNHLDAGPDLMSGLKSPAKEVRALTCDLLRKIRFSAATDVLLRLLKSEKEPEVRGRAMLALVDLHPPERIDEVGRALAIFFESEEEARPAVRALESSLRNLTSQDLLPELVDSLGGLLLPTLDHTDSAVRLGAAKIFEKLGFGQAAEALIELIRREPDGYTRQAALRALGASLQEPGQAEFLVDWITDHPDDRDKVLEAMDCIHHRAAVAPLVAALQSQDRFISRRSAKVLGTLGDPAAAGPLLDLIASGAPRETAEIASESLARTATESDLSRMAELIAKASPNQLKESFIQVDRRSGFGEFRKNLTRVPAESILNCWKALPGDEEVLIEVLESPERWIRLGAITQLGRLDSVRVRTALGRVLREDPDDGVRGSAGEALGKIPDREAVGCLVQTLAEVFETTVNLKETLLRALRAATGQRFSQVQRWRDWVASGLGLGSGIGGRIQALEHESQEVRILAAREIAAWEPSEERRRALIPIHRRFEHTHANREVIALASALAAIAEPSSINLLSAALDKTSDPEVTTVLARALKRAGANPE